MVGRWGRRTRWMGSTGSVAKLSDGLSSSRRWVHPAERGARSGLRLVGLLGRNMALAGSRKQEHWQVGCPAYTVWSEQVTTSPRRVRARVSYATVCWTNLCGVLACRPRLDDQLHKVLDAQISRTGLLFWVGHVACFKAMSFLASSTVVTMRARCSAIYELRSTGGNKLMSIGRRGSRP